MVHISRCCNLLDRRYTFLQYFIIEIIFFNHFSGDLHNNICIFVFYNSLPLKLYIYNLEININHMTVNKNLIFCKLALTKYFPYKYISA